MKITNLLAGIVAGGVSALVFTILHGLIINQIWFMFIPMAIAGAMCGFFLSWSYEVLVGLIVMLNFVYVVVYLFLGYFWAGRSAVSNHLTT